MLSSSPRTLDTEHHDHRKPYWPTPQCLKPSGPSRKLSAEHHDSLKSCTVRRTTSTLGALSSSRICWTFSARVRHPNSPSCCFTALFNWRSWQRVEGQKRRTPELSSKVFRPCTFGSPVCVWRFELAHCSHDLPDETLRWGGIQLVERGHVVHENVHVVFLGGLVDLFGCMYTPRQRSL